MESYQQRVIDEHKELGDKYKKLDNFILESIVFDLMDSIDRVLLIRQHETMVEYLSILRDRIDRFKFKENKGTDFRH